MDIEHMGAKLRMEPKLAFMERKIEERKEKPNAIRPSQPIEQQDVWVVRNISKGLQD